VELGVVMTADKASQVAQFVLYSLHAERLELEFSTTVKYSYLEPTDVITLPDGSVVRLSTKEEDGNQINWKAVTQDGSVITQIGIGSSGLPGVTTVTAVVSTNLVLLDVPLLIDSFDGYGYLAAAGGYTSGWKGYALYKSTDGGASFLPTGLSSVSASVIGTAISVLGNYQGGNTIDGLNFVDVLIPVGTLSSVTIQQALDGSNWFLIGSEIVAAATVTQLTSTTWRLSYLIRGMKGTEQNMSTHVLNDQVILLDTVSIKGAASTSTEVGASRMFRAPSVGQYLSDTPVINFTYTGVNLKPLSPWFKGAGRDTAGTLTILFTRRTRVGGEWRDLVDASLGETSESYNVDIYDGTFTTVKRTITQTASGGGSVIATGVPATVTYSSADQVTDFGSVQSTINFKAYQISSTIGRGFALSRSV
jgi:hypothetical protein